MQNCTFPYQINKVFYSSSALFCSSCPVLFSSVLFYFIPFFFFLPILLPSSHLPPSAYYISWVKIYWLAQTGKESFIVLVVSASDSVWRWYRMWQLCCCWWWWGWCFVQYKKIWSLIYQAWPILYLTSSTLDTCLPPAPGNFTTGTDVALLNCICV